MRKLWKGVFGLCVMGMGLGVSAPAPAASGIGPYYAMPAWDQTLPAATRFIVLTNMNSEAVLDRETGLVWEKSPDATLRLWQSAQIACISKNVGGRGGWKLPSIQELRSLVDPTQSSPALPAGHPFTNVQSGVYWSATTLAADSTGAWAVGPTFGAGIVLKSAASHVWCVRGGPGGDAQ